MPLTENLLDVIEAIIGAENVANWYDGVPTTERIKGG